MADDGIMKNVRYIGTKEEVYTVWNGTVFKFRRGEAKAVGENLAQALLAQPDKFEEEL
jgi:hypothetical protein